MAKTTLDEATTLMRNDFTASGVAPTSVSNPWQALRQFTAARIALGRAGTSLPTKAQLDFQFAHARARDAVHLTFNHSHLAQQFEAHGLSTLLVHSAADNRDVYLQRPDLGRRLNTASQQLLQEYAERHVEPVELAIVVADGLSALAIEHHALPMVLEIEQLCRDAGWKMSPVILAEQSRVALADEVGELLKAKMVVILIGERPGLSSPDSLGLYFTWSPKVGLNDAYRNCISNVRLEGLSYQMAAHRLGYLMHEAYRRQLSGVNLKDEAQVQQVDGIDNKPQLNFLLKDD
jgi:ethanolamine ammonia-lyase small subunit